MIIRRGGYTEAHVELWNACLSSPFHLKWSEKIRSDLFVGVL